MGNTETKNEIDLSMTAKSDVLTDIYKQAGAKCDLKNEIDISGDCDASKAHITQYGACKLNVDMKAVDNIHSTTQTDMKGTAAQLAKSISQNFSLNPGNTSASNRTNMVETTLNEINTNLADECITGSKASNVVKCYDQGKMIGAYIDETTALQNLSKCAMNSDVVSEETTKLAADIDQRAIAVQQNAIAKILFAIAAVFLSIGVAGKLGGKDFIKPLIILFVVASICVVGVALVFNYINKGKRKVVPDDYCADCTQYDKHREDCQAASCNWVGDSNSDDGTCECDFNCITQCPNFDNPTDCKHNHCAWMKIDGTMKCTGDKKYCNASLFQT